MTSATELRSVFEDDALEAEESAPSAAGGRLKEDSPPSVGRVAAAFAHDARLLESVLTGFAAQRLEQIAGLSRTAVKLVRSAISAGSRRHRPERSG